MHHENWLTPSISRLSQSAAPLERLKAWQQRLPHNPLVETSKFSVVIRGKIWKHGIIVGIMLGDQRLRLPFGSILVRIQPPSMCAYEMPSLGHYEMVFLVPF